MNFILSTSLGTSLRGGHCDGHLSGHSPDHLLLLPLWICSSGGTQGRSRMRFNTSALLKEGKDEARKKVTERRMKKASPPT